MSDDKKPKVSRKAVIFHDPESGASGFLCNLDMRECDHDWPDTNDSDDCCCTKCGQSLWAHAFMECP